MAHGLTRKQIKHDEFIEAASDAGHWLEDNWRKVAIWGAVVLAAVLIVLGWNSISRSRAAEARLVLAEGQRLFAAADNPSLGESGTYAEALPEFERAHELGGNSPTGQVALYYKGVTLLRMGDAAGALSPLDRVSREAEEPLIRQSATVVLAEAAAETGDRERAAQLLRQVASDPQSLFPPEQALMMLAQIRFGEGDTDEANRVLQEIVDGYPQSSAAVEARTLLGQ